MLAEQIFDQNMLLSPPIIIVIIDISHRKILTAALTLPIHSNLSCIKDNTWSTVTSEYLDNIYITSSKYNVIKMFSIPHTVL